MYNERRNVKRVIEKSWEICKKLNLSYEIIIVDDGSIDDTYDQILNRIHNKKNIRVISYEVNIGKGYAIKTGFNNSKGDYVVFLDGDLEINPNQIGLYIDALKYGDIVIGSKNLKTSRVIRSPLRKFLSVFFNFLVRLITGLEVRDTQSGLKAVKKKSLIKIFRVLTVKRFAFDVELLTVAHNEGLKILEIPINIKLTRTTFNIKEILLMFIDLLGIRYRVITGKYNLKK